MPAKKSTTDAEATGPTPPARKAYVLKPGLVEVVRSGLVIKAGDSVNLTADDAARHADVLTLPEED